jgi:exopolysaccharide biosynthesis polyprenyl glycosylphosphotransferase
MLDSLSDILENESISSLLVDQRTVSSDKLHEIEIICSDMMVALKMIPWSSEVWTDRLVVDIVDGVPLLRVKELLHDRNRSKIVRRIVDIFGSLLGLVVSAPVIAVLAFLIKRESPGPVFYRQTRLGLNKKPFELIKLRSMRLDVEADSGVGWTVKNDPRRLEIGEFMRAWNLDELPQFWNVLKGEMSLVGPRPERPEFVEKFRESLHYYNLRHSCKPGMTGWAAVHGLRGDTSLEDRLDFDLYYIEHWSLILDFRIMLMTLISRKNAY